MACVFAPDASAQNDYRLTLEPVETFRLAGAEVEVEPQPEALPARFADLPFARLIHAAARDAALEPALVHAVISVESAYNARARSHKGAIGLMQLMPATAARYGVRDPSKSPEENLRAGTLYLRDLIQLFDGRIDLALAAYNAGENAVLRHGERIPPYAETLKYVPAVMQKYREWREPPAPAAAPAPRHIDYLPGTRLEQPRGQILY